MSEFLRMLLEFLKGKESWKTIQPFVLLGFAYFATEVLAFEYIQSQFGFKPSLRLFVGSYFFIRVTIVFAALALLILFQLQPRRGPQALPGRSVHLSAGIRRSSRFEQRWSCW